jgi:adenylosuccinate synthase
LPVTVVVGAQYGGEGKGKITSYLAGKDDYDLVVRCGGPNSGHTVLENGKPVVVRQVPAAFKHTKTRLAMGPGCLVDLEVLLAEINQLGVGPDRFHVDPKATMVLPTYKSDEAELRARIGSTASGTGVAVAKRALRDQTLVKAGDVHALQPYLTDVADLANNCHDHDGKVLVEGTQGFGLSLFHSPHYPHVTSRDTTAAAFLSEAGLSPKLATEIILVCRTFPIRVAGPSGPLQGETSWEEVGRNSGNAGLVPERTSVTKTVRRIGTWEPDAIRRAIRANRPTTLALTGLDLVHCGAARRQNSMQLPSECLSFIARATEEIGHEFHLLGTGPGDEDIVDLRLSKQSHDDIARGVRA